MTEKKRNMAERDMITYHSSESDWCKVLKAASKFCPQRGEKNHDMKRVARTRNERIIRTMTFQQTEK